MKLFLTLILTIFSITFIFGQENTSEKFVPKTISEKDSTINFLCFIDITDKSISNAHNGLLRGFKAKTSDSMMIMTNNFNDTLSQILNKISLLEVSPKLSALKNAYFEKIKSLNDFFYANSYKLVEYENSKRTALSRNTETDTKYIDKQISDFFKDMNNAQSRWQSIFDMERDRLSEMQEPTTEIKK